MVCTINWMCGLILFTVFPLLCISLWTVSSYPLSSERRDLRSSDGRCARCWSKTNGGAIGKVGRERTTSCLRFCAGVRCGWLLCLGQLPKLVCSRKMAKAGRQGQPDRPPSIKPNNLL